LTRALDEITFGTDAMTPEKNSVKARTPPKGKRWEKGKSGNPKGRTPGTKNRVEHLTIPDAVAAAQLAKRGLSADDIAKALHAKPAAVKEALGQARQLLESFAPEVAKDWIDASRIAAADGDHKPAMALLQSIDVVKPVAQTYDTGPGGKAVAAVKVEIHNFGFAGLPDPQPQPAIDVTATESKS
jgi:hypothetical protein